MGQEMKRDVAIALSVALVVLGAGFVGIGLLQHSVIQAKVVHLADYLFATGGVLFVAGFIGILILLFSTNDGTRA